MNSSKSRRGKSVICDNFDDDHNDDNDSDNADNHDDDDDGAENIIYAI